MEKMKNFAASALIGFAMLTGLGVGIMAIGFAVVIGGALALAVRLAEPSILSPSETPGEDIPKDATPA